MMGKQYGYLAESAENFYRMEFSIDCLDDYLNTKAVYVMFEDACSEEKLQAFKDQFEKMCRLLNGNLKHDSHKYLAGEKLTIADFMVFMWTSILVDNSVVKH